MTPDIEYLLSLEAVRERSRTVFEAAKKDELSHFDYHPDRLPQAAAYLTSVIHVSCCFPESRLPCPCYGILRLDMACTTYSLF